MSYQILAHADYFHFVIPILIKVNKMPLMPTGDAKAEFRGLYKDAEGPQSDKFTRLFTGYFILM